MPEPNEATPDAPFSTTGPTLQATTNSQSATTAKATAGSDAPLANGAPLDVVSAVDSMTTAMKSVLPSSGTDIPSSGGAPAAPSVEHTTQPAQAPGTTVVPPTAEEEDPKVTSLRAMFPDFDVAILQSILESVNGDQDRAIEALLGMSDPDYVSSETPRRHQSETSLDEELAQRLALEEENAHARRQIGQQVGQPASEERYQTYRPSGMHPTFPDQFGYASVTSANQVAPQSANDGDTFAEVQKQIASIAETGKKTFSTIFTKVKAKIAEFEQSQATGWNPPPPAGAGPAPQPGSAHPPSGPASYFDPHSGASGAGPSGTVHSGDTPSLPMASPGFPAPAQPKPVPAGSLNAAHNAPPPGGVLGSSPLTRSNLPARSSNETPRPPSTSTGPPTMNAEPSRAGSLAKKPVHLVRESVTAPTPQRKGDDDDLGYM